MEEKNKVNAKQGKKRKMSGWLIVLIVVVVMFGVGAICCNTIVPNSANSTSPSAMISQQDGSR